MSSFICHHYIITNDRKLVVDGWSDGPTRDRSPEGATLIYEGEDRFQFTLPLVDGTFAGENVPLADGGVYLYEWLPGMSAARRRSEDEVEADRAALPIAEPQPAPPDLAIMQAQIDDMRSAMVTLVEGLSGRQISDGATREGLVLEDLVVESLPDMQQGRIRTELIEGGD